DLAAHLDTDLKALQELNPALLTSVTPPGKKPYILRVPRGVRDDLTRNLIGQSVSNPDWVVHRVRIFDTLQRLASRFGSNANLIMKTNGLRSNSDLRPGRFVIIPL
ncbi:MAG: LysM peptidoglycan-binding domain-containing protein, partial [SAR324 cluster bacterium]|nr:LysM peptidoglycan-binding domain-containing protein [SAR324 cluster bacterium]